MKRYISIFALCFVGCATHPRCGYPEGNRVVYENPKTCVARIRQVTVGNELKIPESLKGAGLVAFRLEWVEPALVDGRIGLGHFVLLPLTEKAAK